MEYIHSTQMRTCTHTCIHAQTHTILILWADIWNIFIVHICTHARIHVHTHTHTVRILWANMWNIYTYTFFHMCVYIPHIIIHERM